MYENSLAREGGSLLQQRWMHLLTVTASDESMFRIVLIIYACETATFLGGDQYPGTRDVEACVVDLLMR